MIDERCIITDRGQDKGGEVCNHLVMGLLPLFSDYYCKGQCIEFYTGFQPRRSGQYMAPIEKSTPVHNEKTPLDISACQGE